MANKQARNWIVTGGSGFIGRELVCRILLHTEDRITLLLRPAADGTAPRQRIQAILQDLCPTIAYDPERLYVLASDLTKPTMGLSVDCLEPLFEMDNHFIHLAANTSFMASNEAAVSTNLDGVKHAVSIARLLHLRQCLQCFCYVSTAYVHGGSKGVVMPDQPLSTTGLRNQYETSKCLAEQWVRSQLTQLPVILFRPSIVVGDSLTGRASGNSSIYWALRWYLRGRRRFFARSDARLDIVPVDYVIGAMLYLSRQATSIGQCFPLVAGHRHDISLQHLADSAALHYKLPKPVLMNPAQALRMRHLVKLAPASERFFLEQMLAYLPYFSENPQFSAEVTNDALANSGINRPLFDQFAAALFNNCDIRPGPATRSAKLAVSV